MIVSSDFVNNELTFNGIFGIVRFKTYNENIYHYDQYSNIINKLNYAQYL